MYLNYDCSHPINFHFGAVLGEVEEDEVTKEKRTSLPPSSANNYHHHHPLRCLLAYYIVDSRINIQLTIGEICSHLHYKFSLTAAVVVGTRCCGGWLLSPLSHRFSEAGWA